MNRKIETDINMDCSGIEEITSSSLGLRLSFGCSFGIVIKLRNLKVRGLKLPCVFFTISCPFFILYLIVFCIKNAVFSNLRGKKTILSNFSYHGSNCTIPKTNPPPKKRNKKNILQRGLNEH